MATHDHSSVEGSDARQAVTLAVEGMHCAACSARIEKVLSRQEGVESASVSLSGASATVKGRGINAEALAEKVTAIGYPAHVSQGRISPAEQRSEIEQRDARRAADWRYRMIVGGCIWVPLELVHWFGGSFGLAHHSTAGMIVSWTLATAAMALVGKAFYVSAWSAARTGGTNMDTLIAIGSSAAYLLSTLNAVLLLTTDRHDLPLYFGEAAGLLTLISIGHYLEAKTTTAAGAALRELLSMQPDEVERLENESASTGETVPSADVEPGDLILVRPGQRVPVDGEIVSGASALDESLVTGEPVPAERGEGDAVIAGTMNTTGRLVIRATTDGRSTTVARMAEMVAAAQSSKTQIQRLADRVTSIFIPAVLIIAALTAAGWMIFGGEGGIAAAVVNATTVLIISCPCALGLATPTAVMVGSGEAGHRSILVKSARALERGSEATVVVFDKTGTLTEGRPRVVEADDEALRVAAALAHSSSHPLSKAVVEAAQERGLDVPAADSVSERAGRGLEGNVDGSSVELISRKAAEAEGIVGADEAESGYTASVVVRGGEAIGTIRFDDELRDDAAELISTLRQRGLQPLLLTGDRRPAAKRMAERLGLEADEVFAELSPEEKVAHVKRLAESETVVMVGDGVNDAAALAEAGSSGGVGVAMATGTNIAIEAADVVIPGTRLGALCEFLDLSAATLRTIRQNLFLSFFYNSAAIPAAAFGLLGVHGPLIAAGAMGLSDLCVIGNSLRLRYRLRRQRGSAERTGSDQ